MNLYSFMLINKDASRIYSNNSLSTLPSVLSIINHITWTPTFEHQHTNHQHRYCSNKTREAYELSMKLKDVDPVLYNTSPVSILTLFDLNKKSELLYLAHQLADTNPKRPESWFAVGCYYLLIRKTSVAQSYFEKSTSVDPHFAPAWIGYGNAFAAQDESDQAMAAYRTFKKNIITLL